MYLSWIYAWFTTPPEPDVVVIDLRESFTVGPLIDMLEWVMRQNSRYRETSLLGSWLGALRNELTTVLHHSAIASALRRRMAPLSDGEPSEPAAIPTDTRSEQNSR
jgi:hypothetical protein